ncbi:uncharacterized protein LOC123720829 isoform X2 [Pieris brassicae]|uniref:uncharacterized protein LOC123720829 isoform X2 n=1 Tax=Pieris brassicae TaxID=7116 RepID=UPI001E65EC8E|nr:uncharacterized protein LOC123720829 isoform X2 [Pieris brassicae]
MIPNKLMYVCRCGINIYLMFKLNEYAEDMEAISRSFEERVRMKLNAEKKSAGTYGYNHFKIPNDFKDFGRRFVLQYPYTEKKVPVINITDEDNLHKTVKDFLLENDLYEQSITLVQAPPDIVLEVARQSALLQAATPINPSDDVIHRNILRSGDYWNDVVEEPVNTDLFLRSKPQTNINSLHLRFQPGSNLYDLVTELKKISPRLLYVINDDSE